MLSITIPDLFASHFFPGLPSHGWSKLIVSNYTHALEASNKQLVQFLIWCHVEVIKVMVISFEIKSRLAILFTYNY